MQDVLKDLEEFSAGDFLNFPDGGEKSQEFAWKYAE